MLQGYWNFNFRKKFSLYFAVLIILSSKLFGNLWASDEFRRVTEVYGPLVVKEGFYKQESSVKPWSSWWYPLWEKTLFDDPSGEHSTLDRYDQFVLNQTGENPHSAEYEEKYVYDGRAVGWAGRCDAWAVAALSEPEPTKPMEIGGVLFRVRDLKALIIKIYEKVEGLVHFGQRFNGTWDSDYEDILPDQFHRFFQAELIVKKLPFIMDYDAGLEVWNSPVWKVQTRLTTDPQNPNVINVKTWLTSADPHIKNLDFVGTGPVVHTYTYDLYGVRKEDGSLSVTSGKWTENSRWDHPDYLIPIPKNIKNSSSNKNISKDLVEKIIRSGRSL